MSRDEEMEEERREGLCTKPFTGGGGANFVTRSRGGGEAMI